MYKTVGKAESRATAAVECAIPTAGTARTIAVDALIETLRSRGAFSDD
jgi:hypothetical protein